MNTLNLKLFFIIIILGFKSFSQNDSVNQIKGKKAFGGIPILSYDADIGLRYGLGFIYFNF
jgi:hypothetical protein